MDSIIFKVTNSNQYSIIGVLISRWCLVSIISAGNLLLNLVSVLTAQSPVESQYHHGSMSSLTVVALEL